MSYNTKGGSSYGGIRRARRVQARRSDHAKAIDSQSKAPRARSVNQWLGAPNRFDLPTVDTNKPSTKTIENHLGSKALKKHPHPQKRSKTEAYLLFFTALSLILFGAIKELTDFYIVPFIIGVSLLFYSIALFNP